MGSSVVEPRLQPLAATYVLITVITGPIIARLPDLNWFKELVSRPRPAEPAGPPATD